VKKEVSKVFKSYLMKRLILPMLLILFSQTVAHGLEFDGYYENQFFPQRLGGRWILQDYNKLRLDVSAEIAENVSFNGDCIYRVYHGSRGFNAFDLIPESVVSQYANMLQTSVDSLRPSFNFEYSDENFLDNAYVTIYSDHVNIRIGKQQLPWGSGYAWNPTDIFNAKNLMDPTYEKTGVNAFKLEIPFGDEGMITGILCVEENWRRSTKAVKAKQHLLGFDLSASYVEKEHEGFDYTVSLPIYERRKLLGGDFSGELFGLGIWAEGAYSKMEVSEDFGQYLFGADYTFENGLYLIGEYYRNEMGKTGDSEYTFGDWMRLLGSYGENLGQNYVYLGELYPIAELWNWSNYVIVNLNDKSGVFFPWFVYSLNDDTELAFVGYIPFGKEETEFGGFGAGGLARIRVYF
jgi:hypothetical protein